MANAIILLPMYNVLLILGKYYNGFTKIRELWFIKKQSVISYIERCVIDLRNLLHLLKTKNSFNNMEIPAIKAKLTLSEVIKHYGLKPDKQARFSCLFQADKSPSFQVYYKT